MDYPPEYLLRQVAAFVEVRHPDPVPGAEIRTAIRARNALLDIALDILVEWGYLARRRVGHKLVYNSIRQFH